MEYHNLSAEELKNQIEETKQREAELKRALSQRWQAEKAELAQEIRQLIEGRGFNVEEVLNHILPARRRRSAGAKKAGSGSYTRYVDPENPDNFYSRGVLPRWMKDKMSALGLDPGSKDDREAFKTNHLRPTQD